MSEPVEIDYSIDRPSDAWMHAVAGFLARCFEAYGQHGWQFFMPINKELRYAGCASYADWLAPRQKYGGEYYPPVDQPRLVEISALTAIQAGLKRDHFDPASHRLITLEPNQVKELRELQEKAIREVNKRLRDLERDDDQPTHSDDFASANSAAWPARKIPPEKRTRPMSLREAARLMGYGKSRDAAEKLRAAINTGAVFCETLTRQQHVFSLADFPRENWSQAKPE